MKNALILVLALACAACGNTNDTDDDGGTPDASPDAAPDAAAGEQFVVEWGPTEVGPGQEKTQCVIKKVGNTTPIHVNTIHNVLGATSHHFILSGTNATQESITPTDCFPFTGSDVPLMITQKPDDRLVLPDGVGFTFQPGQFVAMELHYINVTTEPQMARATTTFTVMPDEDFEYEASYVFLGNLGLPPIQPHQVTTLGPQAINVPDELDGVNFFAITGHQHQWGTNVYITKQDSPGGPEIPVYDLPDFKWDEPETVRHDPPFNVGSTGRFNVTCTWENMSDNTVGFGLGVDDEMCFFWAYYYPARGGVCQGQGCAF